MQFNLMYFNVSIQSNAFVLSAKKKKPNMKNKSRLLRGIRELRMGRARPEQGFLLLPLNYI